MAFVHRTRCPHIQPGHTCRLSPDITACPECDRVAATGVAVRTVILDNLAQAKAEATAAGQTARATIIQNMIDRISAITINT